MIDAEKNEIRQPILNTSRQDISKIDFSEYSLHFYRNKNQVVGTKYKIQETTLWFCI